eukprot:Skav235716  [mRNA]  locus=scaffold280:570926:571588:+ [translate_table: standard]
MYAAGRQRLQGIVKFVLSHFFLCQVVEMLVQSQADINNADPVSPVAAAARAEKWSTVRRLVELRADPNLCTEGRTAEDTTRAVGTNAVTGSNMNSRKNGKNESIGTAKAMKAEATPLILAVKAGEQDLVEFLCSNGASTHLMDDTSSACGAAAAANHLGILKLLGEVRADLDWALAEYVQYIAVQYIATSTASHLLPRFKSVQHTVFGSSSVVVNHREQE